MDGHSVNHHYQPCIYIHACGRLDPLVDGHLLARVEVLALLRILGDVANIAHRYLDFDSHFGVRPCVHRIALIDLPYWPAHC